MTVATVVIVLLVGISRFCLGVHYPTDVLAGLLDGIALGIGGILIENVMYKKLVWYADVCNEKVAEKQDSTTVE